MIESVLVFSLSIIGVPAMWLSVGVFAMCVDLQEREKGKVPPLSITSIVNFQAQIHSNTKCKTLCTRILCVWCVYSRCIPFRVTRFDGMDSLMPNIQIINISSFLISFISIYNRHTHRMGYCISWIHVNTINNILWLKRVNTSHACLQDIILMST